MPGARCDGRAGRDVLPAEADLPARGRQQADDRAHGRGLAHAVAAEQRDDSPSLTAQVTPNSTWLAP
jgi:hypothetical protein